MKSAPSKRNFPQKSPRRSGHIFIALVVMVVCAVSVASAARALTSNPESKATACEYAYKHVQAVHNVAQHGKYFIPDDIRRLVVNTAMKSEQIILDHCPRKELATTIAAEGPLPQASEAPVSAAPPLLKEILESLID